MNFWQDWQNWNRSIIFWFHRLCCFWYWNDSCCFPSIGKVVCCYIIFNVSGETKDSTTGFIKIVGMLIYLVEQSFRRSPKYCSTSSYHWVNSMFIRNSLLLESIIFVWERPDKIFSSSLLCGFVIVRRFPVWLKYLFISVVSASRVLSLGFKMQWTIFQISFEFFDGRIFLKSAFFESLIFFFSLFPSVLKFVQISLLGIFCARNLCLSHYFCNTIISSCFIHGAGCLVNFVLFSEAWRSIWSKINLFYIANWSSGLSKV